MFFNNIKKIENLNWKDYKLKKSFNERVSECQLILKKYPDKIPIIVNECSDDLKDKIKRKMLLQSDMTVSNYLYSIRQKFKIKPEESFLLFVNGKIPTSTTLLYELYNNHKDKDGFLYISIIKENVFGNLI